MKTGAFSWLFGLRKGPFWLYKLQNALETEVLSRFRPKSGDYNSNFEWLDLCEAFISRSLASFQLFSRLISRGSKRHFERLKPHFQLFMTPEIGWGVRTLVDLPKGAFVSTYSGCILTEEGADKLGREIGDKYLCDLDVAQAIDDEKRNQGIFNLDDDLGFYSDAGGGFLA